MQMLGNNRAETIKKTNANKKSNEKKSKTSTSKKEIRTLKSASNVNTVNTSTIIGKH